MIEVKNLSFAYREHEVLREVSFSAAEGQLVSVLGPNGVGKSTLFRCILGLLRSYTGEVLLNGREVRQQSRQELSRLAAYIPQSSEPVFNYTVMDTVLMGTTTMLSPLRRPGAAQREAAERAMEELGIIGLRNRGVGRLSGGERQLVLIARAMVQNARLLVMDEPTANLDYGNQYRVLEQIQALAQRGYTVLLSTHNPEHALRFASHILALREGRVCAYGAVNETITAELIEELYRIPAMLTGVETPKGTILSCIPL